MLQIMKTVEAEVPEWVTILHDKDVDPDTGEIKKPHIHLLMRSKSARTATAVGKQLRIPPEMVELKSNGEGAMAYLTHSTEKARKEGKYRYPVDNLSGPLREAAAEAAGKAAGTAAEGVQVLEILDWIDDHPETERISMAALARWAAGVGLWASFRRAGVIFRTCLEEHNERADALAAQARQRAAVSEDPFRFAKLKAGLVLPSEGRVDL